VIIREVLEKDLLEERLSLRVKMLPRGIPMSLTKGTKKAMKGYHYNKVERIACVSFKGGQYAQFVVETD